MPPPRRQPLERAERRQRGERRDREQQAVEGADQRRPGHLGGDHGDRLRADRIAEAHRARLGPEPVLEPVGPVELGRVVVGVDALAEHADAVGDRNGSVATASTIAAAPTADPPARGLAGARAGREARSRRPRSPQQPEQDRRGRRPPGQPDQQRRDDHERREPGGAGEPRRARAAEQRAGSRGRSASEAARIRSVQA